MNCLLAAVADDFTGGSDLAGMLRERGVRTLLLFGVPEDAASWRGQYQAVVVCLKTRAAEPAEARRQSVAAVQALQPLWPRQILFKYCSTFDSTPRGNIGPVAEALLEATGANFTAHLPALPVNGRTQYLGHLFVNGELLNESPLRDHPLNPMTDPNLVRWLGLQTRQQVGLLPLKDVRGALRERAEDLQASGVTMALVDAVENLDLDLAAEAFADLPLLCGGSGWGVALPAVWRRRGWLEEQTTTGAGDHASVPTAILAGSCSAMTLRQLRLFSAPQVAVDVPALQRDREAELARLLAVDARPLVIRSSAEKAAQQEGAAPEIEWLFGELARRLVAERGVRRLIVAGGETSGAVVSALGVAAAEVTRVIAPGVPALRTMGETPLRLVLKSGNFGGEDFFAKAIENS
jgi:3-dehydrotetronate 4-kinase